MKTETVYLLCHLAGYELPHVQGVLIIENEARKWLMADVPDDGHERGVLVFTVGDMGGPDRWLT